MEKVAEILAEASAEVVEPRFRALAAGEVMEKAPGDVVTIADREAEVIISRRLRELLPVPVVGEEAVAADPALARALHNEPACWLVDPVDGTANFVAGRPDFAVMASLIRDGQAVAAWIWQPMTRTAYSAELGAGAWRDGRRLTRAPADPDPARWRGFAKHYLRRGRFPGLSAHPSAFGALTEGRRAAGMEYPQIADGELEFLVYWRTLPWDHAPGSLLVRETGGVSARLDGSPYRADPPGGEDGLLVACDQQTWERTRAILLGGTDWDRG
ncbi:inositol monophosphatase [Kitasatospora sp. NBC_01287]|uniref:inositol monophosphatase family protein n=1 Tax=Kitasatospora sp. NBC_01287 TaxID=2903573 RepID=UPI0022511349|nr:inositol monophosphatase family protein [Kitasatospora sp. NBC_01287]MCX4745377.1 inositol monophosphatase [Kitasatospora sp. NBC_01287]